MARNLPSRSGNDYLTLGAGLSITPPFSVAALIYPYSFPTGALDCVWASSIEGANSAHEILIQTTGAARVFSINGGIGGVNSTTTMSTDTWNFIQASWGATNSRTIWLNGAGSATNTTNVSNFTPDEMGIGRVQEAPVLKLFDGRVEYVFVWSEAMTAAEAAALSKGIHPLAVKPNNLVDGWDLTRNINGLKGNNLTATGTTVIENSGLIFPSPGTRRSRIFIPSATSVIGQITDADITITGQTLVGVPTAHVIGQLSDADITITGQTLTGIPTSGTVGQISEGSISITGQTLTGVFTEHVVGQVADADITITGQTLTGLASGDVVGQLSDADITITGQTLTGVPTAHVIGQLSDADITITGQTLVGVPTANAFAQVTDADVTITGQTLTGVTTNHVVGLINSGSIAITGQLLSGIDSSTLNLIATISTGSIELTGQSLTGVATGIRYTFLRMLGEIE